MSDILYVVIPCYNEQEVLPETSKRLKLKLNSLIQQNKINSKSRIVFVNDGSKDNTWQIITGLHNSDGIFSGINLSRNQGHQNALLAGLLTVKDLADMVISMDADLQDDIDAIDRFVEEYYKGAQIVYGVRRSRETDSFFKRTTAQCFYRLMSFCGADIVYNHADYRLMSKRAINELAKYNEVNLFLRGIVPLIGFKTSVVEYDRQSRFAGESKYPLKKMLSFAFNGITSFSIKPIRAIFNIGVFIFAVSILILLYCLVQKISGNTVQGWTFIVWSIWMLGGIQLLCIGIVGEYTGKIYSETKRRPRFIVDEFLN